MQATALEASPHHNCCLVHRSSPQQSEETWFAHAVEDQAGASFANTHGSPEPEPGRMEKGPSMSAASWGMCPARQVHSCQDIDVSQLMYFRHH